MGQQSARQVAQTPCPAEKDKTRVLSSADRSPETLTEEIRTLAALYVIRARIGEGRANRSLFCFFVAPAFFVLVVFQFLVLFGHRDANRPDGVLTRCRSAEEKGEVPPVTGWPLAWREVPASCCPGSDKAPKWPTFKGPREWAPASRSPCGAADWSGLMPYY